MNNKEGRLRFYTPKGNWIKDFEPPHCSDQAIESLNESQGLMIDSETSDSLWEGESFDVGIAGEALLHAEQGRIGDDGMRVFIHHQE